MGWTFQKGATRADIVRKITRTSSTQEQLFQTLEYKLTERGKVLWCLHLSCRNDSTLLWIGCYLLESHRGFGWGYKAMDEGMGPFYYTCPLGFLDRAPVANEEWRANVRAIHASKKHKCGDNANRCRAEDAVGVERCVYKGA